MAAVLSACPSKKSKSQENLRYVEEANPNTASDNYVLDLLAQLPPSRDLLKHYQEKLESYEKEEEQLLARIQACAQLLDTSNRLENELSKREADIEGLKDDLEAVSIKLHSERRTNLKLGAENDKLRIKDVESQRKINVLLRLCGKSDQDIVRLVDQGGGIDSKTEKSEKITKLQEKASLKNRRSSQSLELEVVNLEQQLLEQEKLHRNQLKEERELKKKSERTHLTDKSQLREKITEFQASIAGLENQIQILTSQLGAHKSAFRKRENNWLNERTVFTRKLQFFEKFGTLEGTHSEHRFKSRVSGDKKLPQKLQKLENEVESKDREIQIQRQELLKVRNEIQDERLRSDAAAKILAKKTKSMTEQVNVLTDRCEKVEHRKSLEVQGYKSDIKLLRDKLSQLEGKLLALSDSNTQEQENKALLEQLRMELKLAEQRKPRQWRD
eukprot:GFUD01016591.1.p1 GENE.GFUD01016591.1~~GFUD01016591.1.p1  ORF type:complete len:443 (-),score=160.01 GFUD01016591.1:160-1488(-)